MTVSKELSERITKDLTDLASKYKGSEEHMSVSTFLCWSILNSLRTAGMMDKVILMSTKIQEILEDVGAPCIKAEHIPAMMKSFFETDDIDIDVKTEMINHLLSLYEKAKEKENTNDG